HAPVGPSQRASVLRRPDAGSLLAVYGTGDGGRSGAVAGGNGRRRVGGGRGAGARGPRGCAPCRPCRIGGARGGRALLTPPPGGPRRSSTAPTGGASRRTRLSWHCRSELAAIRSSGRRRAGSGSASRAATS